MRPEPDGHGPNEGGPNGHGPNEDDPGERDAVRERALLARVARRLVPFLVVCYCLAYVDRVNVSVAALTMNRDLGLGATAFGLGSGLFFAGYVLFEVPSNLLLLRHGARRSIGRIMIGWGLVAAMVALASGPASFCALRFALGIAEAGFFPAVLFLLASWFPAADRARILSIFMVSIPVSAVLGGPASVLILLLNGVAGLRGWQWVFILEGLPAALLGVVALFRLPDSPAQASWLPAADRAWMAGRLALRPAEPASASGFPAFRALLRPDMLALCGAYAGLVACTSAVGFWLPQIVRAGGAGISASGLLSALPPVFGAGGMVLGGQLAHHVLPPRTLCALGFALGGAALLAAALVGAPSWRLAAFSLALFGLLGGQPQFWTLPAALLSGASAAVGFAAVNSIGALFGLVGPTLVGLSIRLTGSFDAGAIVLGLLGLAAAVLALLAGRPPEPGPADEIRVPRVPSLPPEPTRGPPCAC